MVNFEIAEQATRRWLQTFVVEHQLCPFAKPHISDNTIRFVANSAKTEIELLEILQDELIFLVENDSVETTLIIHPHVLTDFFDYNQFLGDADYLIEQLSLEGVLQIASFHPNYQFANCAPDDAQNYSNRSPFPMIHILRESSIDRAVNEFENIELIPERNINHLRGMGVNYLQKLWRACFD